MKIFLIFFFITIFYQKQIFTHPADIFYMPKKGKVLLTSKNEYGRQQYQNQDEADRYYFDYKYIGQNIKFGLTDKVTFFTEFSYQDDDHKSGINSYQNGLIYRILDLDQIINIKAGIIMPLLDADESGFEDNNSSGIRLGFEYGSFGEGMRHLIGCEILNFEGYDKDNISYNAYTDFIFYAKFQAILKRRLSFDNEISYYFKGDKLNSDNILSGGNYYDLVSRLEYLTGSTSYIYGGINYKKYEDLMKDATLYLYDNDKLSAFAGFVIEF